MSIINQNDFTGYFEVYKPRGGGQIQSYIDVFEPRYMAYLLGEDLASEITEEIGQSPIPERAQKLLDKGLKTGLVAFVWSELEKDSIVKNSGLGIKKNQSEASQDTDVKAYTDTRYNAGVRVFNTIQQYVHNHREDYEGFEPTEITLSYF